MQVPQCPDPRILARPSGGFAMLALDQRESMRAMFTERQSGRVSDRELAQFKLAALRALTPHASAVLVDRPFAWNQAVAEKAVAPGCALIAAADTFVPSVRELISDVEIDEEVVPERVRVDGAVAMKLLVMWREDEPAQKRITLVTTFIKRCRSAGLLSVVEPVSRGRKDGMPCDAQAGIISAAKELGNLGGDIYKAEVPLGNGDEAGVRLRCAELQRAITGTWVVLSSGVDQELFPKTVEWACKEGASGFLAGRAVWKAAIAEADVEQGLRDGAVSRLRRLADVVDEVIQRTH